MVIALFVIQMHSVLKVKLVQLKIFLTQISKRAHAILKHAVQLDPIHFHAKKTPTILKLVIQLLVCAKLLYALWTPSADLDNVIYKIQFVLLALLPPHATLRRHARMELALLNFALLARVLTTTLNAKHSSV